MVQIFSSSARTAGDVGCYQQSKCGSLTGGLKDILFHFVVKISAGSQKQSKFCSAILSTERPSCNFYIRAALWGLSSSEDSSYSGSSLWEVEVDVIAHLPRVPWLLLFHSVLSQYYKHQPPPKLDTFLSWSWKMDTADKENYGNAVIWFLHCLPASLSWWKDETPLTWCFQWDCSPFHHQQCQFCGIQVLQDLRRLLADFWESL